VGRLASADTGGDGRDHPVTDLLQIHDVGTVEDGEVDDQTGGPVQIVQHRDGGAVQAVLVHGK
jgi:hypothetical protein